MPVLPGAHADLPAIMVGEKIAEWVREDLGVERAAGRVRAIPELARRPRVGKSPKCDARAANL
ncbi:MAG TPA: hypothetical protein VNM91_10230 [Dehalococcoidia bacterium]|nr:hypothetical protein [Dehalococcoidia bacterium]